MQCAECVDLCKHREEHQRIVGGWMHISSIACVCRKVEGSFVFVRLSSASSCSGPLISSASQQGSPILPGEGF